MANKHQQKTEATRRKLLDAGRRVFARSGFEAARIEDIAGESGYTRGAFYANFDTKEDLFFALLEQHVSRKITELQKLVAGCTTREEWLQTVRDFYLKRANDRQWTMLVLEFKLFALRHGTLRAKLAAAHRRIRASLNFELAIDLLPPQFRVNGRTEEIYRATLEAVLSGLVIEHAYDPKRISAEQVSKMLGLVFDMLMA